MATCYSGFAMETREVPVEQVEPRWPRSPRVDSEPRRRRDIWV